LWPRSDGCCQLCSGGTHFDPRHVEELEELALVVEEDHRLGRVLRQLWAQSAHLFSKRLHAAVPQKKPTAVSPEPQRSHRIPFVGLLPHVVHQPASTRIREDAVRDALGGHEADMKVAIGAVWAKPGESPELRVGRRRLWAASNHVLEADDSFSLEAAVQFQEAHLRTRTLKALMPH
jgi:hypothetical protein